MSNENEDGSLQLNITSEPSKRKAKHRRQPAFAASDAKSEVDKGENSNTQKTFPNSKKKDIQLQGERVHPNGPQRFQKKTYVSSLFKSNPEIPHITNHTKQKRQELLFTNKLFSDLSLHSHLVSCLESKFEATTLTEVQCKAIPELMNGRDVLVKSCTGSGKTLAYAVPIVQALQAVSPKIHRADGTYALVVLPTRELALQSYECFSKLTKAFTWIVPGYLIGGEKKSSEKARIRKGINILVSTPGRLLDHLDHTANLSFGKVCWLVIDEADKLQEEGFENAAVKIISRVKQDMQSSKLQTVLLSATLSKGVEKLAGMSLVDPVCIDIAATTSKSEEMTDLVVPAQLKQFVVITPIKLRLVTLSAFIADKCSKGNTKALIFFCTQNSVDFHFLLFNFVLKTMLKLEGYKTKFYKLHGNMKQEDRTDVFGKFKSAKNGILLCTDVAARGLDLPEVDWIIQYSAPVSAENYVHRVGRTARIGKVGHSLLFLIPSEIKFINLMQEHQIYVEELDMQDILNSLRVIADVIQETGKQHSRSKNIEQHASDLQQKFENIVYSEDDHHTCAKKAFLSFVQAYASYPKSMVSIIPFKMLHLGHVAKSFCLRESPIELGCHQAKPSKFKKPQRPGKQAREQNKRKLAEISEFDSGLDAWKQENMQQAKKQKKRH